MKRTMKKLLLTVLALLLAVPLFASCDADIWTRAGEYEIGEVYLYLSADGIEGKVLTALTMDGRLNDESSNGETLELKYNGVIQSLTYERTVTMMYNRRTFDIFVSDTQPHIQLFVADKKIVGINSALSEDERQGTSRLPIGEEELKARAREFAETYSKPGHYELCELSSGGGIVQAVLYNEINGYRVGDYALVNMLIDGTVVYAYALPDSGIYSVCKGAFDPGECDAAALDCLKLAFNRTYTGSDYEVIVEYAGHEILDRIITLDDDGMPILVYYYHVSLLWSGGDGQTEDGGDFAYIVLELKTK